MGQWKPGTDVRNDKEQKPKKEGEVRWESRLFLTMEKAGFVMNRSRHSSVRPSVWVSNATIVFWERLSLLPLLQVPVSRPLSFVM